MGEQSEITKWAIERVVLDFQRIDQAITAALKAAEKHVKDADDCSRPGTDPAPAFSPEEHKSWYHVWMPAHGDRTDRPQIRLLAPSVFDAQRDAIDAIRTVYGSHERGLDLQSFKENCDIARAEQTASQAALRRWFGLPE